MVRRVLLLAIVLCASCAAAQNRPIVSERFDLTDFAHNKKKGSEVGFSRSVDNLVLRDKAGTSTLAQIRAVVNGFPSSWETITGKPSSFPANHNRLLQVESNGQGQYASIATACSAATSGDLILLYPGEYTVANTITLTTGVSIMGFDPEKTIVKATGIGQEIFDAPGNQSISNLTILNLTNNAAATCLTKDSYSQSDLMIRNCVIRSDYGVGIDCYTSGTIAITNCTIISKLQAVYSNGTVLLRNCSISNRASGTPLITIYGPGSSWSIIDCSASGGSASYTVSLFDFVGNNSTAYCSNVLCINGITKAVAERTTTGNSIKYRGLAVSEFGSTHVSGTLIGDLP